MVRFLVEGGLFLGAAALGFVAWLRRKRRICSEVCLAFFPGFISWRNRATHRCDTCRVWTCEHEGRVSHSRASGKYVWICNACSPLPPDYGVSPGVLSTFG